MNEWTKITKFSKTAVNIINDTLRVCKWCERKLWVKWTLKNFLKENPKGKKDMLIAQKKLTFCVHCDKKLILKWKRSAKLLTSQKMCYIINMKIVCGFCDCHAIRQHTVYETIFAHVLSHFSCCISIKMLWLRLFLYQIFYERGKN